MCAEVHVCVTCFHFISVPPLPTALGELTLTVTVNDSFVLEVMISNYNLPIDSITWQRKRGMSSPSLDLSNNTQFILTNSTNTLGYGNATLTALFTRSLVDAGLYTLIVSNPAGTRHVTFNITIHSE